MAGNARIAWAALLVGAVLPLIPSCDVETGEATPGVEWLERVVQAEEAYVFEGVREVSSRFGEHSRTRWYFERHKPGAATVSEGMGRPAGRRSTRRHHMSRLYWFRDRELLLTNYRLTVAGREMVAERPGVVLEIMPVRTGRPSIRMVVDEETGLLIGMERRDHQGRVIYRSRFTTLLVEPAPETADRREERRWPPRWGKRRGESGERGEEPERLVARYLPDGFERKHRSSGRHFGRRGHHELFSDGLCWLSMSQRPAREGAEERVVEQRQWGDRVVLKMVYRRVEVKVMGGLDPEELMEMIRSLGPVEE